MLVVAHTNELKLQALYQRFPFKNNKLKKNGSVKMMADAFCEMTVHYNLTFSTATRIHVILKRSKYFTGKIRVFNTS